MWLLLSVVSVVLTLHHLAGGPHIQHAPSALNALHPAAHQLDLSDVSAALPHAGAAAAAGSPTTASQLRQGTAGSEQAPPWAQGPATPLPLDVAVACLAVLTVACLLVLTLAAAAGWRRRADHAHPPAPGRVPRAFRSGSGTAPPLGPPLLLSKCVLRV